MKSSSEVSNAIRHTLIPAVPLPLTASLTVDVESQIRYTQYMGSQKIGGVAVWAHTGRGLHLTPEQRARVLTRWRNALPDKIIIAGVGCPIATVAATDADYIAAAVDMTKHAASLGADAVLAYAPVRFRGREDSREIVEYHNAIASVGLPVILFYLYEAAGGISYKHDVLRQLLALPNVIGIKMATLDSVMTFQEVAAIVKSEFPDKLLITGEDRFLGYSLMMGADAALIGMGAALTALQCDLLAAWFANDLNRFRELSAIVDRFAMATFCHPMEGYIARMLYALSRLSDSSGANILSEDATVDPWGPPFAPSQLAAIARFLESLPIELRV